MAKKKKATKKKATKKRGARKNPNGGVRGRSAMTPEVGAAIMMARAVAPRSKGFRSKKVESLYDRFTRKTVRKAALECASVNACRSYIDEMLDGLDTAFAEWETMRQDIGKYTHSAKVLADALAKSDKEIKSLKTKLTAERKKKKPAVTAADAKTVAAMLEDQRKHVIAMMADIKKTAKKAGVTLKVDRKRKPIAAKPPKRKPAKAKPGRLSKTSPASGAGCSLAGARYGYSGKKECAPDGYGYSEAGRRLANLRHHGVAMNPAFNPEDYFEMGYEAAVAEGHAGSKAAPKKKAAKRNPAKKAAPRKKAARKPVSNPNANGTSAAQAALAQRQARTLRRLGI